MMELCLARQPVFDNDLKLLGYEIAYYNTDVSAEAQDPLESCARLITMALIDIGLDNLVGSALAFIPLKQEYVLDTPRLPFPADNVVLMLDADDINDELFHTLNNYRLQGYKIALDHVHSNSASLKLLELAHYARIDIARHDDETLAGIIASLDHAPVETIAINVEHSERIHGLQRLGFDYLQGDFFSKPAILKHAQLTTNQVAMSELLSRVYDPEIEADDLADIIGNDVTLSYHILRYINSAFFTRTTEIDSIRQAIIYLGRNELRIWATVIAMANYGDKPDELIKVALVRGRMCESLARESRFGSEDAFFTVGLLSVLDTLMDQSMETITQKLPLSTEIKSALQYHETLYGDALATTLAYENCDWQNVRFHSLTTPAINNLYLDAIHWADTILNTIRQ